LALFTSGKKTFPEQKLVVRSRGPARGREPGKTSFRNEARKAHYWRWRGNFVGTPRRKCN